MEHHSEHLTAHSPAAHPSVASSDASHATGGTAVRAHERAVKPVWKRWFCVADGLYWDGTERDCWFCGSAGTAVSAPRRTSQHGFDPDLVA